MKISGEQIRNSLKYGGLVRASVQRPIPPPDSSDIVNRARFRVLNSSAVRLQKVCKVKEMLATGGYEVSADQVAEKLLGRILSDQLR